MTTRRRICVAATAIAALVSALAALPGPATAETRPSLLDFLTPENIMRRLVQVGIGALRSETELQYDHILPDPLAGEVTITGITAWPDVPWEGDGCTVTADRATLSWAEPQSWDKMRLRLDVIGLTLTPGCLAPDPRDLLDKAGLKELRLAQGSVDLDYTISSAEAAASFHFDSPGLALVDGRADFTYLAPNAAGDGDSIAAYLSSASVTLVNQGGWAKIKGFLPEAMQAPATAGAALTQGLSQAIGQANADADTRAGNDADSSLTEPQQTFVMQAGRQFARFVSDQDQITIATALAEDEVRIGSDFFDDPRAVFDALAPTVQAHPVGEAPLIEAGLMSKVLGNAPDATDDMRLAVGSALLTGTGAPKSVAQGRAILEPLAKAGDTKAALDLAQALAESDPATAYGDALAATAAGEAGASAVLDGIEERLDTKTMLAAQGALSGISSLPDAPFVSISALRSEALARMAGDSESRSYPLAWFWASLAAAAGDPAAADLRDGIDRRMRLHGAEAEAAWAAARAPMEAAALHEWVARNLGGKFGPKTAP